MFEVTLSSGIKYQVANKELGECMNVYANADTQEKQGQWLKAYAVAEIVKNALWSKDNDYESVDNFYNAIDIKAGQARKYMRVVTFKEMQKDLAGISYLSINAVDALSGIEDLKGFITWLKRKNIKSFEGLSERRLLDLKAEFLNKKKAKDEKQETEKQETESTETKEIEYVIISYQGKKYKLDKSILETLEEVK